MSKKSYDVSDRSRLRQRLWGAVVLIAIAVIVLPVILDGAGSESQFKQVERLRTEPTPEPTPEPAPIIAKSIPSLVADVTPVAEMVAVSKAADADSVATDSAVEDETVTAGMVLEHVVSLVASEVAAFDSNPKPDKVPADKNVSNATQSPLTAWVVQAGLFSEENEALRLRDELRRTGFASFVRDREFDTDPFRVFVGPMIKKESAEKARVQVASMLKNNPVLLTYP